MQVDCSGAAEVHVNSMAHAQKHQAWVQTKVEAFNPMDVVMTNDHLDATNQANKLDKVGKVDMAKPTHKTHHKSNSGSSGSSKGTSLKSQSKQHSMASGHSVTDQNMKQSDPIPPASLNSPVLTTEKLIGEGLQAKVYKAYAAHKPSETQCVKVFFPFKNLDQVYSADTEFKIARLLEGHPNIIRINTFEKD